MQVRIKICRVDCLSELRYDHRRAMTTTTSTTSKHEYVDYLFLASPVTNDQMTGCTIMDVGLTKEQVSLSLDALLQAVHIANLAHKLKKVAPERTIKRYLKGQLVYEVHFGNGGACGTETRTYSKSCQSAEVQSARLVAVHCVQQRVPNHAFTSANNMDEIQYLRQLVIPITGNTSIIMETIKTVGPRPPHFRLSFRTPPHGNPMSSEVSTLIKSLIGGRNIEITEQQQ